MVSNVPDPPQAITVPTNHPPRQELMIGEGFRGFQPPSYVNDPQMMSEVLEGPMGGALSRCSIPTIAIRCWALRLLVGRIRFCICNRRVRDETPRTVDNAFVE